MALLRQLRLQRRQCLLNLRQRGFLRKKFGFRYRAGVRLLAKCLEYIGCDIDKLVGYRNLTPQVGFLNRR